MAVPSLAETSSSTPVSATPDPTSHSTLVGADRLHAQGITGAGVTLAVLDTGLADYAQIKYGTQKKSLRALAQYDAIANQTLSVWSAPNDDNGHATHVTSISLNSEQRVTVTIAG